MGPNKQDSSGQENQPPGDQYQPGQLRAFLDAMKMELGESSELLKQALADLNAEHRQIARNHFESRQEYIKQVADHKSIAMEGLREYGLQTLKWSFLLNAGAIAIILAYIGGWKSANVPLSNFTPLLKALWPFTVGCFLVVLAGAAGFFNFSYAEASLPSIEALHNFSSPTERTWPLARFQKPDEAPMDFYKRFSWKMAATRNTAIALTLGSGLFFLYGVYRVLRAVLT